MSVLKSFLRDEAGAAAAEYALILAVVATVIATAASGLATAVATAINAAAAKNLIAEGTPSICFSKGWMQVSTATMEYSMSKFITSFLRDESGAAAAEYALILAVVATVIATAASGLATAVADAINAAAARI